MAIACLIPVQSTQSVKQQELLPSISCDEVSADAYGMVDDICAVLAAAKLQMHMALVCLVFGPGRRWA